MEESGGAVQEGEFTSVSILTKPILKTVLDLDKEISITLRTCLDTKYLC